MGRPAVLAVTLPRRSVLAGGAAALAGCGLLPEGPEPIEAEAVSPADLPASSDYSAVVSETRTFETTITVDLSGDVELTSRRDVTATVFRRVYEDDAGRRLGLVTAPAVVVIESPETVRDPVASLDAARVVALATDRSVDSVDEFEADGQATLLSTETTRAVATAMAGVTDRRVARLRVRAGEDAVTAVGEGPDAADHPFGDVTRET